MNKEKGKLGYKGEEWKKICHCQINMPFLMLGHYYCEQSETVNFEMNRSLYTVIQRFSPQEPKDMF